MWAKRIVMNTEHLPNRDSTLRSNVRKCWEILATIRAVIPSPGTERPELKDQVGDSYVSKLPILLNLEKASTVAPS